ncbi:signal transduction histidine kinase [Steroidobacter agaridevorans]|uniref:histidine kinase n=1 Tax=Steroidobacter agaridevorans TaxID=2695856 RepID=A0A829YK66_9GAMM|nr:HWE histidine kinase domain-containing protein [Steroidobacter agaridevorans]GFE83178.1 signal transduction histidine kinase [Steroidobacter agaridevorans]
MTAANASVDPSSCDREPIHLLGAIQPFGFLIAVSTPDWLVQRVSANVGDWLKVAPADMLGRGLLDFIHVDAIHTLRNQLQIVNVTGTAARLFGIRIDDSPRRFDMAVHTQPGQVVIECELSAADSSVNASALVRGMMNRVQGMRDPSTLSCNAARELRALTGFDRVMVYRFAPDESGEVIAESTDAGIESFLGLHYPASDIPRQARLLYERNWLRIIPDIEAVPSPIQPTLDSAGKPLDLSHSVLRSVSPIHIEYLRNMGVRASMSVSILREGRLWGLFACHHYSPLHVSFERRTAAELFGQMFSLLMENREREAESGYENRARELNDRLVQALTGEDNRAQGIARRLGDIATQLNCDGIGLSIDGKVTLHGMTPEPRQFVDLIEHIRASTTTSGNHAINAIRADYPQASEFQGRSAGMLVMPLSRLPRDYLVFFRREVAHTVTWAGDPNKPVVAGPLGDRLTPRKSFESWRETVSGQAVPWSAADLRIANALRMSLLEAILRQSDQSEEARRRAMQRQDLLIAELNHRVRNILSLIRGLINQSHDPNLSSVQFMDVVGSRLQALARAHDLITADHWGPALFSALIDSEAGAYLSGDAMRIQRAGPDARLQPQAFNVLALVIHELITNSTKYGALSDRRGTVTVATQLDESANFIIDWRERDGPPVQTPKRRGFGSAVIERTIPYDIKGEAQIDFEPLGVHARFLIPSTYVQCMDKAAAQPTAAATIAPDELPIPQDVLLVEDNLIIALDAVDALRKAGARDVRPASNVSAALGMIEERQPEFAVLDVNLGIENSFEVANRLLALGVPFAFMTGYGENEAFPDELAHVPRIRKPFTQQSLAAVLGRRR